MSIENYVNVPTTDDEFSAEIEIETAAEITSMSTTEHSKLTELDYESSGHTGFAGIKYGTTEYWNTHASYVPIKNYIIIYTDYQTTSEGKPIYGIKIGDGETSVSELSFTLDNVSEELDEIQEEIQSIENAGYIKQDINTTQIEVQYTKSKSPINISEEYIWENCAFPSSKRFLSGCFGRDLYVLVGMQGAVIYSSDGKNWTEIENPFTNTTINKICFGNGFFLALCFTTRTIYKSYDLIEWTVYKKFSMTPRNIQYINNQFFIVGDNGYMAVSLDGEEWTEINTGTLSKINAVCFGKGKYIAVGDGGLILYSLNGKKWVEESNPSFTKAIKYVYFGGNLFVLGGENELRYSTNGYNWNVPTTPDNTNLLIEDIVWGEGRWYITWLNVQTSRGEIWESFNGRIYSLSYRDDDQKGLYGLCYGKDQFIAMGEDQKELLLDLKIAWTNEKPNLLEDEYLWSRNVSYFNNGDVIYSNSFNIYMPKKLSELQNDVGYITIDVDNLINYYNKQETDDLLSAKVDKKSKINNNEIDLLFE